MGLSEYQRKEFDPNNCHPHHERWEVAITHTESEFRHAMWMAWAEGNSYVEETDHMTFNEWFDKNYGDIIGIGTEAPASEKMSGKEEMPDNSPDNSPPPWEDEFGPLY